MENCPAETPFPAKGCPAYRSSPVYRRSAAEVAAGEEAVDWTSFEIGRVISAVVHEKKDYGIICDLIDNDNLVGLIPLHQVSRNRIQSEPYKREGS
jgi:hypothetical protein